MEYELSVERMTPCGKEKYRRQEFVTVCTDDPEAWTLENAPYPVTEVRRTPDGEVTVTAANEHGYVNRYIFTPL